LFLCRFYSDDPVKVEQLVLAFIQHGPGIVDPAANQALALALAKLSQEPSYMAVIEKLGLLQRVLELLLKLLDMHKDSLLLQESCCIAICRIALKIDTLDVAEKQRIAQVFFNMLETDDQYVLGSTISGISALGKHASSCITEFGELQLFDTDDRVEMLMCWPVCVYYRQ
jgi:hypothetical protein